MSRRVLTVGRYHCATKESKDVIEAWVAVRGLKLGDCLQIDCDDTVSQSVLTLMERGEDDKPRLVCANGCDVPGPCQHPEYRGPEMEDLEGNSIASYCGGVQVATMERRVEGVLPVDLLSVAKLTSTGLHVPLFDLEIHMTE